jgi:long-chain acyl-CoA synthetase
MLSNRNFLSAITNILKVGRQDYEINSNDTYISYLPLAHVFDRLGVYASLSTGAAVGFFGGEILKIMDDLAILKPTIFPSVPRLLNKVYDKVILSLKEKPYFK